MIRRDFIWSDRASKHECDACEGKAMELLTLGCGCRYPSRHTSIIRCRKHPRKGILTQLPVGFSGIDKW